MGLLEEVAAARQAPGSVCVIRQIRAALTPPDAADLDTLLTDYAVQATQIARALSNRGHKIASGSIQRHRRGDCCCG